MGMRHRRGPQLRTISLMIILIWLWRLGKGRMAEMAIRWQLVVIYWILVVLMREQHLEAMWGSQLVLRIISFQAFRSEVSQLIWSTTLALISQPIFSRSLENQNLATSSRATVSCRETRVINLLRTVVVSSLRAISGLMQMQKHLISGWPI